jgi:hypothetical protein
MTAILGKFRYFIINFEMEATGTNDAKKAQEFADSQDYCVVDAWYNVQLKPTPLDGTDNVGETICEQP